MALEDKLEGVLFVGWIVSMFAIDLYPGIISGVTMIALFILLMIGALNAIANYIHDPRHDPLDRREGHGE